VPAGVDFWMTAAEHFIAKWFWPTFGSAAVASNAPQSSIAEQAASETVQRAFMIYPPKTVSISLRTRY
jgi:hypothetical protein